MIYYHRYLFVKKNVFNYSELHFSEGTFYKIHTLKFKLEKIWDWGLRNLQEKLEKVKDVKFLTIF